MVSNDDLSIDNLQTVKGTEPLIMKRQTDPKSVNQVRSKTASHYDAFSLSSYWAFTLYVKRSGLPCWTCRWT